MKRPPNLTAVPDSDRRPMTKAESELMIMLTIGGDLSGEPVKPDELESALSAMFKEAFTQDLAVQILFGRLRLTDKLYDPRTVAMVAFLADRPGFAVLWAYTLFERSRELDRPYGFDDLVGDFPMGFPTSEGAAVIWDAQKGWAQEPKVPIDNLLDQDSLWKEPADAES